MYIGRFAPSPTGSLHLGSIMIAISSFIEAKVNNGNWHLKIDDLDSFRIKQSNIDQIIKQLENLGLSWDGEIIFQSKRIEKYFSFLDKIKNKKITYVCNCSRKKIMQDNEDVINKSIYSGTCKNKQYTEEVNNAIRVISDDKEIFFKDEFQGFFIQNIKNQVGDFILKRSDNLISYQLAVVIDDYLDQTTHIVRGYDLIESTPRQIYLQKILGFQQIQYKHLPIINFKGKKLSKSHGDNLSVEHSPKSVWLKVLKLLNQSTPPKDLTLNQTIQFAIKNWNLKNLKKSRFIEIDDYIHTS